MTRIIRALKKINRFKFSFYEKIIIETNFVSSWIKLWSTGTSIKCWSSVFDWFEIKSSCRDGEGVGGGFGWVKVNGNSTAKSL